jgi:hypothetical protein
MSNKPQPAELAAAAAEELMGDKKEREMNTEHRRSASAAIEKATENLKIAEGRTALLKEISKGCQALVFRRRFRRSDEDLGWVSGEDLAFFITKIGSKVEEEEKAAREDLDNAEGIAHYYSIVYSQTEKA